MSLLDQLRNLLNSPTEKDHEKCALIDLVQQFILKCETSIKKSLYSFSSRLLSTKFSLQNAGCYWIIEDFLKKVQTILDFQLNNTQNPIFSVDLLVKPIIDLANSKVSEYKRATQPLIFAVNLYGLLEDLISKYPNFKEKSDKIYTLKEDYLKEIIECMHNDILKRLGFQKNNENELEQKEIVDFLRKLSNESFLRDYIIYLIKLIMFFRHSFC